ncbi:Methyltransferase-like protein 25 [Mortierella polycephala]|uniref:Methyltransferase-like protein 25 n=1 Tax=Mortierella polycephala TaxID=41804 RepID=A0A9P6PQE3_9FUNG|nr:Methyltransferase-like protein 25 [Mortierella polycephala]
MNKGNSNIEEHEGIKAFLPLGFSSLEEYLVRLQAFLTSCEPITNLMIVDYFTTDSWVSRMPQDWRDAFESEQGKLSSLDLMKLVSLGKLRDFTAPPAGSTQEVTMKAEEVGPSLGPQDWPESLKDFVRMVKELSINRTLDPDYAKFKDTLDIHLIPGMSPKKLHEVEILSGLMASYAKEHSIRSVIDLGAGQGYLSRVLAFQHQLCVLGVDSNTIQTCGAQTTQKRTEKLFVNKSRLKNAGSNGKKAPSSASKQKRNNPVAATSLSSLPPSSTSVSTATGTTPTVPTAPTTPTVPAAPAPTTPRPTTIGEGIMPSSTLDSSLCSSAIAGIKLEKSVAIKACKKSNSGSRSRSSSPSESIGSGNSSSKRSSRSKRTRGRKDDAISIPASKLSAESCTEPSIKPISEYTNVTRTTASNTPESTLPTAQQPLSAPKTTMDSASDPSLAATPGSNFQLQHITHHITAATLPTLLKEHFPKKSKPIAQCDSSIQTEDADGEEGRWTLCGLHACGDLTSNMIKLYLESTATCLFSVGCCYHWITERYDKDGNIAICDGTHGFPLSAAFNRHKAHLGDHAKMIACQSPERWLEYQKETEDAIHGHYFRALLHKLMVERGLYPGPPTIAPVLGRMGKHRLKGFPHYLATALHRLRLPADVIRPEEAQAAYEEFLEKDLYRIGILWALRTMLGPLFEGMILLDRATYLHESIIGNTSQDNSEMKGSVQLVAGFDVVESPRNMILIALKDGIRR